MKGIVYYNQKGKILNIVWGDDVKGDPEDGIPFLEIDVPSGAVVNEVDLSSDPPKIVFTKYPGSDYTKLENKVKSAEETVSTFSAKLSTTDSIVATHEQKISESEENITNLELAVASLYEGGLE